MSEFAQSASLDTEKRMDARLLYFEGMAKKDLPNFSIFGRIVFGVVAILMIVWLLRLSGIV